MSSSPPGRSPRLAGPCRREAGEPEAEFGRERCPRGLHGGEGRRDVAVGQSAEVLPDGRLGGQGTVDDLARNVVFDVTVRLAPGESGADSAPELVDRRTDSVPIGALTV